MSETLQLRRGTAAQVAAFIGAQGEVVVDTTSNRLVLQDGATAGGFPAAKLSEVSPVSLARRAVSDANATALSTDRIIAYTAITAARVVSLLAAASYPLGAVLGVVDESGAVSATNTITLTPNGSDRINGATILVVSAPYGRVFLESDGVSRWTITNQDVFDALGITAGAGVANGLATLDSTGRLPLAQLTAAVVGALDYQGAWNASTNSPTLVSSVGTKGQYYKASVAGTTSINGVASWNVGDLIAFDGTTWDKFDGQSSEVVSVAGRVGAVTLTSADLTDATTAGKALLTAASVAAQRTAINFETLAKINDANATVSMVTTAWTAITAARTGQLPAASGYNPGQEITLSDWSGNASPTLTITALPNGSDTIVGATTVNSPYGALILTSDGVSKWQGVQDVSTGTSAGQNVALNSAGKLPAIDGSNLINLPSAAPSPMSIFGGLPTAFSGNNTTASISVSACSAADASGAVLLTSSALTLLATNGNAINGCADGTTLLNSKTYHVYLCKGGSGYGLYASQTFGMPAASAPSGYNSFVRRLFSFTTTGAGAPVPWLAIEAEGGSYYAWLVTQTLDISTTALGTTLVSFTLNVPTGLKLQPFIRGVSGSASSTVIITSGDETNVAPTAISAGTVPLYDTGQSTSGQPAVIFPNLTTNTSGQVNARALAASTIYYQVTRGFKDWRRV